MLFKHTHDEEKVYKRTKDSHTHPTWWQLSMQIDISLLYLSYTWSGLTYSVTFLTSTFSKYQRFSCIWGTCVCIKQPAECGTRLEAITLLSQEARFKIPSREAVLFGVLSLSHAFCSCPLEMTPDFSTCLPLFAAVASIPLVRALSLLTQLRAGSGASPQFNPATWHTHSGGTCRFHKHINVILNLELVSPLFGRHTINSIHFKRPTFLVSDPFFFFLNFYSKAFSPLSKATKIQTSNTSKPQEDLGPLLYLQTESYDKF